MPLVGAVTGLEAEARIASRFIERVLAVGSAPGAAETAARRLVEDGAQALISFGLAGALDAALEPGALILGEAILDQDGTMLAVDAAWLERAFARLADCRRGNLAGVDAPVATARAKALLGKKTGALGCDMESHQVARVARSSGLPFLAMRAVVDRLDRDLPPAAILPIGPSGKPHGSQIARSIARQPSQIPDLISLAFASRRALGALFRGGAALGRGFAFGDPR